MAFTAWRDGRVRELQPLRREPYTEEPYTAIEDFPQFAKESSLFGFVPQAGLGLFSVGAAKQMYRKDSGIASSAAEFTHLGSDGFGGCSALLVHDPKTNSYVFGHLEPRDETFVYHLSNGGLKGFSLKSTRAVVVYGTLSWRQAALERLLTDGRIGADVSVIRAETGHAHWHLSFEIVTGELAVVRSRPDQSILTYQALPPQE